MQVLECIFVHYCRLCFHAFPSLNRQKTILCEIDTKTRTQKWGLCGSVAEWSKALDLGSSLSGGVGSNPTTAMKSESLLAHVCVFCRMPRALIKLLV